MTLRDLALKLAGEFKSGKVGDGLDTTGDLLKQLATFYKLVLGTAAVEDDSELAFVESTLLDVKASLVKDCSCGDGSCKVQAAGEVAADGKAVPPALILGLVEIILQIIAARRAGKK